MTSFKTTLFPHTDFNKYYYNLHLAISCQKKFVKSIVFIASARRDHTDERCYNHRSFIIPIKYHISTISKLDSSAMVLNFLCTFFFFARKILYIRNLRIN